MSRRSLRRLVDTTVLLLAALAVAVAAIAGTVYVTYRDQAQATDRAYAAAAQTQQLRAGVVRGETAVRGYALTGDLAFLLPYTRDRQRVDEQAEDLRPLLTARERGHLEAAMTQVREWRRVFAARILDLVATRRGAAVAFARRGIGKRRIDAFNRRVDAVVGSVDRRVDANRARAARFGRRGVVAIVVAVVVALLAALALRRRLARDVLGPMQELAAAATALGTGELSGRVRTRGVQETQTVAKAFNRMAADIERQVSELRELDALKSHFVASVSHELRTPLTSIAGYVEELLDEEFGPLSDEQRESLEVVERNASGLGALIDDLLLLARLEAGAEESEHEPFDLRPLLEELIVELRPVAAARGIELRVDCPATLVLAGDRRQIRQALANLLSNAIKYNRQDAPVDVHAAVEDGRVAIEVTDRGVGVPPDELARLGDRFFRASTAGATKGTGLGLSITRELAERHGGRLEARSEVGEGSTFRLVLPLGERPDR